MRRRPWFRTAAWIGLGFLVVASLGIWRGFETGWIVYAGGTGSFDVCGGRVQRTFDSFWALIGQRRLDAREDYTIYADHGDGEDRKEVALKRCSARAEGDLQCEVHSADDIEGLSEGDSYRLSRAAISNWSYIRGSKFHMGCNPTRTFMRSLSDPCASSARETFSEFQWAATRDEMDPMDHWVDVQLAPLDEDDFLEPPMEARLNRCERLRNGDFACRVDSAPPEAGIETGARLVVEDHRVMTWSYKLGDRFGHACDGAEAKPPLRLTTGVTPKLDPL